MLPIAKKPRYASVSEAHATSEDLRSTVALEAALFNHGAGHPALASSRGAACAQVQQLLSEWVRAVGIAHGLSEQQATDAGSVVLMLGSCALGVPGAGADIDLVAIVPYFVERAHFFDAGKGLVSRLQAADGVEPGSIHSVADAFVPVVKFSLRGVPVDLLLARLKLPQLPRPIGCILTAATAGLLSKCIEDKDVHSLNGARVAAAILRRVPHVARFQTTLRAVKLWAQRRGINHHASGYPGGVAWALLTARVCQLHPNASPSTLLHKFFMTWHVWRFGENAVPVLLDEAADATEAATDAATEMEGPPAHLRIADWSPRDKGYLLPVITPCRPRLCATHSMTRSTLAVLKAEIERAYDLVSTAVGAAMHVRPPSTPVAADAAAPAAAATLAGASTAATAAATAAAAAAAAEGATDAEAPAHEAGRDVDERERAEALLSSLSAQASDAQHGAPDAWPPERDRDLRARHRDLWGALFAPLDFFGAYGHYVAVQLSAASSAELAHWRAFVRSRLRRLVLLLEGTAGVEWVHPLTWPMCTLAAEDAAEGGAAGRDETIHSSAGYGCCFFVGVRLAAPVTAPRTSSVPGSRSREIDLRPAGSAFVAIGAAWEDRAALCPSAHMLVRLTARAQLPLTLRTSTARLVAAGSSPCGTELPFDDPHDEAAFCGRDDALEANGERGAPCAPKPL